ncbi:hypothetical protein EZ428_15110 [Pedobacter frigiditerrae]|uniref:Secreted protein n=1 Tax=Pedobacter frigiditerrae TaxID=2530452 RepID=A0A4R0MUT9_9SPHI|nr:hypothetical protein [Pedobacter frigiditerrae]TCC90593.1 hypothetical protein EZ428_15110 [Pedobacter frigiditerrae]
MKKFILFGLFFGLLASSLLFKNNIAIAQGIEDTGPPDTTQSVQCKVSEHLFDYSTQDGSYTKQCAKCSTTTASTDILDLQGKKIGVHYYKVIVTVNATVRDCKFKDNVNAKCNEISMSGGIVGDCPQWDVMDETQTETPTDSIPGGIPNM